MNTQIIIDSLLWPIKDIPLIFDIGTTGFQPALPALLEVGAVGGMLLLQPVKKYEVVDVALAYLLAAGISFAFKALK